MFRKPFLKFLILFVFCPAVLPVGVRAQQDEIGALIKDVSVDTQKGAIFGYTYQMKFSYHRNGKMGLGRKFTRLYEAIIPNRFTLRRTYRHPLLLISDSERVITKYDVDYMRTRLIEEIERAEREAENEADDKTDRGDGGYWTIGFRAGDKGVKIDVIKLLENAAFSNPQRIEIGGRKTVSIDFSPAAGRNFESALSYLGKIEGRIWIDEADRRITKIEGFPVGSFAAVKDQTEAGRTEKPVFLFSQLRVEEGFWFPQYVYIDFTKHPDIFDTVRIEFSFDKYKKSTTEVRSTAVESPDETKQETKQEPKPGEGTR
jgi:hypothetical protein